jgi:hypothetical protein
MSGREYEFGLDNFMPVSADEHGNPISGDQVVRNTVEEGSSPNRSGSIRSTSASTTATT